MAFSIHLNAVLVMCSASEMDEVFPVPSVFINTESQWSQIILKGVPSWFLIFL